MSKEAMKLAREALENWVEYFPQNVDDIDKKAITALREALAKPDFWEGYVPEPVKPKEDVSLIDEGKTAQQELVAWMTNEVTTGTQVWLYEKTAQRYQNPPTPLYTSPPAQRTWVELTDDDIDDIYQGAGKNDLKRAREVLAAFKEKNT